jgi:hypothetical protein
MASFAFHHIPPMNFRDWMGSSQAVMAQILRRSFDLGLESAPGRDLPVLLWSLVPWW